jgi:hypothetical protein
MKINEILSESFWSTAKAVGSALAGAATGTGREIVRGAKAVVLPGVRIVKAGAEGYSRSKIKTSKQSIVQAIDELLARGLSDNEIQQLISQRIQYQKMKAAGMSDQQIHDKLKFDQETENFVKKQLEKQKSEKQQTARIK